MMATVEIRVNVGDITQIAQNGAEVFIPHTFIVVVGSDGTTTTVGFQPKVTGIFGAGEVVDNTGHSFDATSGQILITDQQYQDLMGYIDRMKINPPVYDIIGGEQCASWAVNGLRDAGIISGAIAPQGIALYDTLVWNPYLQAIGFEINTTFTTAQAFTRRYDPLTLDLNNNGLETVGINTANPILFDHDGDGVKTATGWVAPGDGLLVWDRNNNGAIDSGRELFGDATLKSNNQLAADGFDALADLDTNHDGTVSALDANFANLKVWRDLNQDGLTQAGELTTLAAQNIASFNVTKTANSQTLANGNQIADLGSYTRSDGSQATLGAVTGSLGDINLASNPFYSQFTDTIPLTQQAQALPDMHGSGMVRSLREAASLPTSEGAALAVTVAQFAAGAYDIHQASIDSLVRQWSATSTFATTAGGAYGARPLTLNLEGITTGSAAYNVFLDKLSTVERFNGQTFRTIPADTTAPVTVTILREQQALIDKSYQALKLSVYDSLVVQTRLKPYFDAINFVLRPCFNLYDRQAANDAVFEMRRMG